MKNKTYLFCTAALLAACSFFGCNDDESIVPENGIGVSVTAEDMATKGSAITTSSFAQFGVDGFLTTAVAGKETHYINNGVVNKSDTDWTPIYQAGSTTAYAWASSPIAFWARAPYAQAVTFAEDFSTMSFNYTLPAHTSDNADATLQQDIVAAYTKVSYADTEASTYTAGKGKVNFTFGHALAGIRFDITDLEEGWTLTKVTLSGIYAGGSCTVTPATSGAPTFAWTLGTATGTYVQTVTSSDFEEVTVGEGVEAVTSTLLKESTGKVFFIPPQTFPTGATVTLTLKKGTRTVDVSASIAGQEVAISKMYTFKVAVADRFESITLNGVALAWTVKEVAVATDNTPQASQFAVTGDGIQNVYEQHNAEENKPYRQTWIIWSNTAKVSFKVFSPVEGTYEIKPFVKKGDGTIEEGAGYFLVTFLTGNNDGTGTIGNGTVHEATKVEFTVKDNGAADDDQLFFKTYVIDVNGMRHSLDSETQLYDMRGFHYFMVDDPLN